MADSFGLRMLYADSTNLVCDDVITTDGAINLWVSMLMVVLIFLAFLHHKCTSR